MAHCSAKITPVNVDSKKAAASSISRKKQGSKSPRSSTEFQPKANLQRGKVPLNWNLYLEQNPQEGSSQRPRNKYVLPKDVTTQVLVPQHVIYPQFTYPTYSQPFNPLPSTSAYQMQLPSTGICVGIDCEMVGVGDGRDNMLARVSLVDEHGSCVYDTFVQPQQRVIDYRTAVSGVRPQDMEYGLPFYKVQEDVDHIIKGKLLIGHAIRNDLKVLYLSHPKRLIRDTSKFKKFRDEVSGRTPSLRFLAAQLLNKEIQQGEHSSIEDARAAMSLYMKYRHVWERELRTVYNK